MSRHRLIHGSSLTTPSESGGCKRAVVDPDFTSTHTDIQKRKSHPSLGLSFGKHRNFSLQLPENLSSHFLNAYPLLEESACPPGLSTPPRAAALGGDRNQASPGSAALDEDLKCE